MNNDGYIDESDFSEWQIDVILSEGEQYLLDGDFNGDPFVDSSDYATFDSNSQQGVEAQRPLLKRINLIDLITKNPN